jgi:murein DD-endopeptidase MepM/ murein hydrolase activator NlpD
MRLAGPGGGGAHQPRAARLWLGLAAMLLLAACAPRAWSAAGETAVAGDTAGPTVVILPNTPAGATATPTAAAVLPSALPSATRLSATDQAPGEIELTLQPCADQACASEAGHLWLARPIAGDQGYINYVERSYPYGSTQSGQREPHHGVEFFNPSGTPVLAAGAGEVIVAGVDSDDVYGPQTNFYGNLVVIEHDQTDADRPVYTLYGHLRSIAVTVGQRVAPGDLLGEVGSTGVAIGAHLHFEVRVGANDYASTRNPELWLLPLPYDGQPQGVVAGRVLDPDGESLPELTVVIRPIATESDRPRNRFLQTYSEDPLLNADDRLQENFAIGDVPRGLYSVSVSTTKIYQQTITVEAGQVAWVTFVVNRPPVVPTPSVTDTPPAPADATPTGPETPTPEGTPLDVTPTEAAPVDATPVEATPVDATPVDPTTTPTLAP